MSVVSAVLAVATPLVAQKSTAPPKNATAQCQDGTYSTAKTEGGACSKHGGVKTWFGASKKTEAKTTNKPSETGAKEMPRAGAAATSGSSAPPSPKTAAATAPKNATAQCQDGTYSTAKTEGGACSKHGGVKTWFGASEKTEAKTTNKPSETGAKEMPRAGAAATSGSSAPPSPKTAAATAPKNATAQCQDGTYSTAKTEGGACSKHGGVKTWFGSPDNTAKSGAAAPAAPATAGAAGSSPSESPKTTTAPPKQGTAPTGTAGAGVPANATARCKDGTYSFAKGHTGACSHHGGVAEWYKK